MFAGYLEALIVEIYWVAFRFFCVNLRDGCRDFIADDINTYNVGQLHFHCFVHGGNETS